MASRIRKLRNLIKTHPALRQYSTQIGFAEFVGCSPGLIRAVENGTPVSRRLAERVSDAVGVDPRWVLGLLPEKPITGVDDKPVTPEKVFERIRAEMIENQEVFRKAAKKAGLQTTSDDDVELKLLLAVVRKRYLEALERGEGISLMRKMLAALDESGTPLASERPAGGSKPDREDSGADGGGDQR